MQNIKENMRFTERKDRVVLKWTTLWHPDSASRGGFNVLPNISLSYSLRGSHDCNTQLLNICTISHHIGSSLRQFWPWYYNTLLTMFGVVAHFQRSNFGHLKFGPKWVHHVKWKQNVRCLKYVRKGWWKKSSFTKHKVPARVRSHI